MANQKVTSGMWRIDPQKRSRVMDRFAHPVASVESEADASLIAAAPDMYELLESLENIAGAVPEELREEIQLVLKRARGDLGLAVFSCNFPRQRRIANKEWLKFMTGLWESFGTESE